jgi:hypothetical protein
LKWIKKGLIFCPSGEYEWSKSHAQVPVVDVINDDIWRIYYTTRDSKQRSRISYIEVEAGNPQNILYKHDKPVIDIGSPGCFDDCGAMCSSLVKFEHKIYMYYIGWNVRNTVSYHLSIGLAVSEDGGQTFSKLYTGPLLDRNFIEPYMCGTCYVLFEEEKWKIWYTSGTKWETVMNKSEPYYDIKYAESDNGIEWARTGKTAIYYNHNREALGVPSVIHDNNLYRMWYSYRNVSGYRVDKRNSYHIGYAESTNGVDWVRMDENVGIDLSPNDNDWDSQMIAYARVFRYKGTLYMLYNGNGFGKTGLGYAVYSN